MKALHEQNYQLIKQHILDPENTQLNPKQQHQLDRLVSAAKLLDKYPVKKQALALHRKKFPEISVPQAYRDLNDAAKLYSTYHNFDWDFWQNWLINDIIKNIEQCRTTQTAQDRKIIAIEHANLLKTIGEKPSELDDPKRNEKHQFFIMVNLNKLNVKIDLDNLDKLPAGTLQELNKALVSGHAIDDVEAEEIINS